MPRNNVRKFIQVFPQFRKRIFFSSADLLGIPQTQLLNPRCRRVAFWHSTSEAGNWQRLANQPFWETGKRSVQSGKENWRIQQHLEAIWNNRAGLFSYLRLRLQMKVNKSPYRLHEIRSKIKQIEDLPILSETAINQQ
jgi:hypothetical protein